MLTLVRSRYRDQIHEAASRAKYKVMFACMALSGKPAYRCSVPLDRLMIGTQCGIRLEQWIKRTEDTSRISKLLTESPYVEFLKDIDSHPARLSDESYLSRHSYFAMGMHAIKHTGAYFNARCEIGMYAQMRHFYRLYESLKNGEQFVSNDYCSARTHRNETVWAYQIADSQLYELNDGHHRAACAVALGNPSIEVLVVGRKATYLQGLIRECNRSETAFLLDPIEAPEVSEWGVDDFSVRYWDLIRKFRDKSDGLKKSGTVISITGGYGWICRRWLGNADRVIGVLPSSSAIHLGNVAYGLGNDLCFHGMTSLVEATTCETYDTVCAEVGREEESHKDQGKADKICQIIEKASVHTGYLALHPNVWKSSEAVAVTRSLVSRLERNFEVIQLHDSRDLRRNAYQDESLVLALRRRVC